MPHSGASAASIARLSVKAITASGTPRNAAASASRKPGSAMSSASAIQSHSLRARSTARRHCRNTEPELRSDPTHRTRRAAAAAACRTASSLPSVDASSSTMISRTGRVCAAMEAIRPGR
ncbi:MAG TPA: hypothetical protein VGC15_08230 [Acetobacteraceae bacterium]